MAEGAMGRLRLRMKRDRGQCMRQLVALITKHVLTSADGETYAIGRVLGVLLMLWGLAAPTAACGWMMYRGQINTVAEWIDFIGAMNLYIPALVAGVVALVTLTSSTEPRQSTPD